MNSLKLINEINKDNFQAELFGGFIVRDINFVKYFYFIDNNINDVFLQINKFLVDNGYSPFDFANKWDVDGVENELMSAYGDPYSNEENKNIILVIYRK